jgi:hypothetical protein
MHLVAKQILMVWLLSAAVCLLTSCGPVPGLGDDNATGCCCDPKVQQACYQEQKKNCKGDWWDSGPCLPKQNQHSSLFGDEPGGQAPALKMSTVPKPHLRFVAFASDETESCFAHCPKGVSGADCAAGKIDKATSDSIEKLRVWVLSDNKTEIQPKELMDLFHVTTDDPCHRGATRISSTGLVNQGEVCVVEAPLVKLDVKAEIHIPRKVEATWDTSSPKTKLLFGGNSSPSVHFMKTDKKEFDPMDSDFGGNIIWIEIGEHRFMARTDKKSCVGIDY